ncbi:hypothetical protein J1G42_14240 [Cellulomonas sp. zg-ZUI222]|uniref:hypothetical protein n=1 Tax=Cellulomonas wangleii TaxID=2816956 RepID=UPI001A94889D|nr:hypothetical protein [Cellulomonas wangleii]MBO0921982.1 hypothetical protein [Cellulomonas wangleii]
MAAMAVDIGPSPVADLAARMGKKRPSDLSASRDALIKEVLIYAPRRGFLGFTVPLLADYIQRHTNEPYVSSVTSFPDSR